MKDIGKLDLNFDKSAEKFRKGKKADKYGNCSEQELIIVKLLAEPLERDEILRQANTQHKIPISETQTLLSLLELKGLIKETLGEIRLA